MSQSDSGFESDSESDSESESDSGSEWHVVKFHNIGHDQ